MAPRMDRGLIVDGSMDGRGRDTTEEEAIQAKLRHEAHSIFQSQVEDTLRRSIDLYQERNAVYKDNFRTVGRLMTALFPEGVPLTDGADFNRWHIFELIIVKLTRYVRNWHQGGHEDSIDDMIVYFGMLKELDREYKSQRGYDVESEMKSPGRR